MENSGIKAKTWDNKEFFFYTELQSDVENAMILMGYDTHGYWLDFFKDKPEPETPEKWERKELFVEHVIVEAIRDLDKHSGFVKEGTQGTIVHVYKDNAAYEVEFPEGVIMTVTFDDIDTAEGEKE